MCFPKGSSHKLGAALGAFPCSMLMQQAIWDRRLRQVMLQQAGTLTSTHPATQPVPPPQPQPVQPPKPQDAAAAHGAAPAPRPASSRPSLGDTAAGAAVTTQAAAVGRDDDPASVHWPSLTQVEK